MSLTFDDNFEVEPSIVFDAPVVLSSDVAGESPHAFDYAIQLDEPFTYSPDDGEALLLQLITTNGLNLSVYWDAHDGRAVGASSDSVGAGIETATVATFDIPRQPVTQFVFGRQLDGDFDHSGALDVNDIDLLTLAVGGNHFEFDINGDGSVDSADREHWMLNLKNTWFGDSNLDGEFSSLDFVVVFQVGKFETGLDAGWSEGDWTATVFSPAVISSPHFNMVVTSKANVQLLWPACRSRMVPFSLP